MPSSSDFNRFAVNPVNIDISRSIFNMDHSVKFSCNVGEVIPFDCIECVPGDTFEIDTAKVIRLQPLVAPIMDEIILDTYWFFVPNRLVWSHWVNFMGENTSSAWSPAVEYNIPTLKAPAGQIPDPAGQALTKNINAWQVGTIADYLGIPVGNFDYDETLDTRDYTFNALPFRAYALICDQWFRSEAVMDPVHVHIDDTNRNGSNGSDQVTDIELGGKPFIACKFFDYFTSALPAPQRGEPVSIPIVNSGNEYMQVLPRTIYNTDIPKLDVYLNKEVPSVNKKSVEFGYVPSSGILTTLPTDVKYNAVFNGTDNSLRTSTQASSFTPNTNNEYIPYNLFAKLPDFNSVTINDLRMAFAIQKFLEKQARYGGRYQEMIKAFFNVDSPDARLQRTEYLGGSRVSLNINQVEQTSATQENGTPLGDVAGMSVTGDSHSDFTKSFTEHGYLIGCAVVRYHHSYQDSTHKMFLRRTPYEFYNPVFANIGELPVYKRELFGYDRDGSDRIVFGYQEAWAEYRYQPSRVCGELRSVYQTPLDMWHLGDHYTDLPSLSPEWIREDKTNLDRCLAVTSEVSNQVICDFFIQTKATRPMPLYSIPGLIDHH